MKIEIHTINQYLGDIENPVTNFIKYCNGHYYVVNSIFVQVFNKYFECVGKYQINMCKTMVALHDKIYYGND